MSVTAIIAEYNPFHKGHEYQINYLKNNTDTDTVVALMSGNFVQRGIPAIYDKYIRSQMALTHGVDLVLELPVCYSTGSAEYFAENAVGILNSINCIDNLAFGMEHDSSEAFKNVAELMLNETPEYKKVLQSSLNSGETIAQARSMAAQSQLGYDIPDLALSNNILALEYTKALLKSNSDIRPIGIKRIGSDYKNDQFAGEYSSASAIRELIFNKDYVKLSEIYSPKDLDYIKTLNPVFINNLSEIMYYCLLSNRNQLTEFLDCDDKLANRINKLLSQGKYYDFASLTLELKSKNYTYTRICRTLIHILLGIKKDDFAKPSYVHILGFNSKGRELLRKIDKVTSIPVLKGLAGSEKILNKNAYQMLEKDINATEIYRLLTDEKKLADDFRHQPVIII